MEPHQTHNISYSSSEPQYKLNRNGESSSSSSENDIFSKNKSRNDWSNLLIIDNSKPISKRILSEEDLKMTIKSYEDNLKVKENNEIMKNKNTRSKSKSKSKSRSKNKNKNKIFSFKNKINKNKLMNNYSGKKVIVLNNGVILKNMNKLKHIKNPEFQVNEFYISKPQKLNKDIIPLDNNIIPNNLIQENNDIIPNSNLNLLLKQTEEKQRENSFHINYIKRPNRSFITKICQYKNQQTKKIREFKRLNSSSGRYKKLKSSSTQLTPVSTVPKTNRQKKKLKTFVNTKIPKLIENMDNKYPSLSSTSYKKFTINSNASLFFSKSNNPIKNNNFTRRPLSSINVVRKEININFKGIKNDNYNNTYYNKSYNMPKTKYISSVMSTNGEKSLKLRKNDSKNIIYENTDFIKQFKELKNAFEFYSENNNNLKDENNYEGKNFKTFRENPDNIKKENHQGEKKIIRKLNSAKIRKNSYHIFYPKEISPLYNYKSGANFEEEEEKQFKPKYFCSKCGYQKHFGNENNCPICITLKENNQLREENLSNIKYYYPFKDKNESYYNLKTGVRNHSSSFNNIFNIINEKSEIKILNNPYYINNMFLDPNYKKKKIPGIKQMYKRNQKNRNNTFEKFGVLQKYFG